MEGRDDYWKLLEEKAKGVRKRVVTGKDDNNNHQGLNIPPSDIPGRLSIVSEEELLEKQITVTPREIIPEIWKRSTEDEEADDDESDVEGKRSWKRSRDEAEGESDRNVVERNIFNIPSNDEEEEPVTSVQRNRKVAECPIIGCEWRAQKLRNHVNRMHLPKIMWDNHYPPVKPTNFHQLNTIRGEVLLFLARKLARSDSLLDLVDWCCKKNNFIPKRSVVLGRHIEQMRSLTTTMRWSRPSYNRYTLWPPNHTSVLIHWRFQVAFLQELIDEDITTYLNFGLQFMNDLDNFAKSTDSGPLRLLPARKREPKWDESQQLPEKTEKIVTIDVCGEPDDVTMTEKMSATEKAVEREVIIGDHNYQLVLRGTSLNITADHRRTSTMVEPGPKEKVPSRQIKEAYPVFDSHFHLDRSSKRLGGDLTLTVDAWLDEPMERPSTVPVNIMGGVLIHCDPDTFPSQIPIEDKWKVAIGIHPKKTHLLGEADYNKFFSLIKSTRVSAIGEIGLDRTINQRFWDGQMQFLEKITPTICDLGKPIILHVRSTTQDQYSALLYLLLLKFLSRRFRNKQTLILHCFTGSLPVIQAWLATFENTYFGFTYQVARFDKEQRSALRAVPGNRLLVETDAPYIAPPGISTNSPRYIGEVVDQVARIRAESIEEVCRKTSINASTVFGAY